MKKKQFNFKNEYLESLKYVKESKKFIYWIIGIFAFFTLVGFFIPAPEYLSNQILKFIKELLEKTQGMSQKELIQFIFLNNLQSSFFSMIFGVLFGIFPIIAAISNGYLLGFVSSASVKSEGILVLWRILPHGVFELPAIFISLGLGLKLGTFIFQKKKSELFKKNIINSIKVFFFIVIPLLIIAGIIEGVLIFLVK